MRPVRQSEIDMIVDRAKQMIDLFEGLNLSASMTLLGMVAGTLIAQVNDRSAASPDEIITRHCDNIRRFMGRVQ